MENTSEQGVGEAHRKDVAPFRQMDESYRINASFRWLTASKHSAEEATDEDRGKQGSRSPIFRRRLESEPSV